MTVPSAVSRSDFIGSGATATFSFPFRIFAATDLLVVQKNTTTGVATTLVYGVDYTVPLASVNNALGGTITLTAGVLATGQSLSIINAPSATQPTSYVNQGGFFPQSEEDSFDRVTKVDLWQQDQLNRSLMAPPADQGVNFQLPTKEKRKGFLLGFDAVTGDPTAVAGASASVTAAMVPVVGAPTTALGRAAMGPWGDALVTAAGSTTARDLQSRFGEVFDVKDFGAKGDGTTDDTTAIQAALNAANSAGGGVVFVPAAIYKVTASLLIFKKTSLRGAGRQASVLSFTNAGDGIQSTWPINSSTGVWITVRDLGIVNVNGANTGGGFVDVGGTFVDLWNVNVSGFKFSAVFDQTEIASLLGSELSCVSASGANVWLVNGADHTGSANAEYTNRITIRGNQFNCGASVPNAIADDGGYDHVIADNNFQGGVNGIRAADASALVVTGNEFEGHQSSIYLTDTKLSAVYVGACRAPSITGNVLSELSASSCILIDACIGGVITGNDFSQAVGQHISFQRGASNASAGVVVEGNGKLVTTATRTAAPFVSAFTVIRRANQIRQTAVTYAAGTASIGANTITPGTMEGIAIGTRLTAMNADGTNVEQIIVTATSGSTFTATFASTKAANFLLLGQTPGDQEAGTWTPTLAGSSVAGTNTYSAQMGHYMRRGNLVQLSCRIAISAKDAAMSGGLLVRGLPFTAEGFTNYQGYAAVAQWSGFTLPANYTQLGGFIDTGDNQIGIVRSGTTVAAGFVQASEVAAPVQLYLSATYSTQSA